MAREAQARYNNVLDSVDCGRDMMETLKPEMVTVRERFEYAIKRLSVIDPEFPVKALKGKTQ